MIMDEEDTLSYAHFAELKAGKSVVWAAVRQPLFKTYSGFFGVEYHEDYTDHYIEGHSPLVYKPKKLVYAGMFSVGSDRIAILTESRNGYWASSETYAVITPGYPIVNDGQLKLDARCLDAIIDGKRKIELNKLALTEDECLKRCRYFNTKRSMRFLDHGLNLTREGKYFRKTLRSMLRQLDEAEKAEYMVDPEEEVKKVLVGSPSS